MVDELIKAAEWTRKRDAVKAEFKGRGMETMATEILHLREDKERIVDACVAVIEKERDDLKIQYDTTNSRVVGIILTLLADKVRAVKGKTDKP